MTDTGAGDTMYAEPGFVSAFWKQVQGASNESGQYTFPCSAKIPDLNIGLGNGKSYTIAGTTFNDGKVSGQPGKTVSGVLADGINIVLRSEFADHDYVGVCKGALQDQQQDFGFPGAPFFLTMFVVWNHNEPSIGFAHQVQP